jgi:hypothetical protein
MEQPKIFVATPMYGGMCHGEYALALLGLASACSQHGVSMEVGVTHNESLVPKARDDLVWHFMRSKATHMLFIDADIAFTPDDVFQLLNTDQDVVAGLYPVKDIHWEAVRQAALAGVPAEALPFFSGRLAMNTIPDGPQEMVLGQLYEVAAVGTGFMMIKRHVFETLAQHTPTYLVDMATSDMDRVAHSYFRIGPEGDTYLSEDYSFCHLWRKHGGKVMVAPWVTPAHIGSLKFCGRPMPIPEEK